MAADPAIHESALHRIAGLHRSGILPVEEFALIERLLMADRHRLVEPVPAPGWFYRPVRSMTWIVGLGEDGPRPARSRLGLGYLQFLLRHPNRDIPAIQLAHLGTLDVERLRALRHENEKARSAVTKAIHRVQKALPRCLSMHLLRTIHTGALCGYYPDPGDSPRWQFTP